MQNNPDDYAMHYLQKIVNTAQIVSLICMCC